jgi:hypothetical protein
MFGRFIRTVIPLVVLSAGPLAVPTFAQVADQQKICSLVENRGFTVGKWSSYNWTGGDATASKLRMAVVGKEPHDSTTYYWYEIKLDDPSRPNAGLIVQSLVPNLAGAGRVRAVIMKTGAQPAMKMPPQMVQMINSTPGMNMAADIARQCLNMNAVGWETVTVPAGQFRAFHMKTVGQTQPMISEIWVQPDLQFAIVKAILKDGGVVELTGQGSGAQSSIRETPVDMPGLPVAPPAPPR